jgi:hypothetical protein
MGHVKAARHRLKTVQTIYRPCLERYKELGHGVTFPVDMTKQWLSFAWTMGVPFSDNNSVVPSE